MTTTTATASAGTEAALRPRLALRPLAIPNEHGGWGFLFEPIVLALLAAPSLAGALVGVAAIGAFLTRHPLKLAANDWLRHKRYPRTGACERIAGAYAFGALVAIGFAIWAAGWTIAIPLAIGAPFGLIQFVYDAPNKGRAALPELVGTAAMAAVAASIALAGGKSFAFAGALAAIALCRAIPAILYVRALLGRGRGAILAHVVAIAAVVALWRVSLAPLVAIIAFTILLARAVVGLYRPTPPAKRIGITELVWGGLTVMAIGVTF